MSAIVTANQMVALETALFDAGMPIAALMEKVAGQITQWLKDNLLLEQPTNPIGILVGPGHNGGDALVVARELTLAGYTVRFYCPFERRKPLTEEHYRYSQYLGIPQVQCIEDLADCQLMVDGVLGLGQTRTIAGQLAADIATLNQWSIPVVCLDVPTGIHTDTGEVLGVAIRATHTLCLGVWKPAFFQDAALKYLGQTHCLDFGVPAAAIATLQPAFPTATCLTAPQALAAIPLDRDLTTHKYRQGQLLLIGGSEQYGGSIVLAGLGARASGVGMLTIAVPASLKPLVLSQLPEALVLACPENDQGAIASLPSDLDLTKFDTIACGPGLTTTTAAVLDTIWDVPVPLLLDADALNLLAQKTPTPQRAAPLLLTPHLGEFRRLFPTVDPRDRWLAVRQAAQERQATLLFKGAKTLVANPTGELWAIPNGTPALARGGSGDVLTGLAGGWLAQAAPKQFSLTLAASAWFHAAAAQRLSATQTVLGVDPAGLAQAIDGAIAYHFAQT